MREIPSVEDRAADREAAVSLMAAVIVRLFQDRECVVAGDLIEAGFSSAEVVDIFDEAAFEASLSIGESEHLALSSDPIAVRRTTIWERAPNVEAKDAGQAAIAAVTVDVADKADFVDVRMADRDNVFVVRLVDGSEEFIELDVDRRLTFNDRDDRAEQILKYTLDRGYRTISGRVFFGVRSSRITIVMDKIVCLLPVWPCSPQSSATWPASLARALFGEETAA